ncbi:hypothetical protein N665_0668s0011 [Sinapis alba]|nr:hypothetical protein N665_0668s0011 [Sinapis alba]
MALHGDSSGEFDIKSPAEKFFKSFTDDITKEKRTVALSLSGNLVSDSYKTFKATITVSPKDDEAGGSCVVWTVEFEKFHHDVEDPVWIIDILINYLKETDENLNT